MRKPSELFAKGVGCAAQRTTPPPPGFDPSKPLENAVIERVANLYVSGMNMAAAYAAATGSTAKQSNKKTSASRIFRRADVRARCAWLAGEAERAERERRNDPKKADEIGTLANHPKTVSQPQGYNSQPIDGEELTADLIKKVLVKALKSKEIDASVISAADKGIKLLKLDAPDVPPPDPAAICEVLFSAADGRASLDEVLARVAQCYQTRIKRENDPPTAQPVANPYVCDEKGNPDCETTQGVDGEQDRTT